MSTLEEGELEEGEITDSDSMGEEKPPEVKNPPAKAYSIFSNPSSAAPRAFPRPPASDSEDSEGEHLSNDDDDDDNNSAAKKKKYQAGKTGKEQFVNPNFEKNGNKMPPMPKPSSRGLWGSVLQEQILTREVGSVRMENAAPNDRDVESYDYMRAKDDDRPALAFEEGEEENAEGELFGEVIDLEKAAFAQRRTLKRKNVAERLGKRPSVKDRLQLPKVTENSSEEEVARFICDMLQETKISLIRRVVNGAGKAKALDLLKDTEKVEAEGGLMVLNGSRRRTPGGVYLTLLKQDEEITKEQMDDIFEDEYKWQEQLRKRKNKGARKRRRQRLREEEKMQQDADSAESVAAVKDSEAKLPSMEVAEVEEDDNSSHSSVRGETGSPKNHNDHLSDSQEGEVEKSDDGGEEEEDFDTQLAREMKRQAAAAKDTKEPCAGGGDGGDGDGDGGAVGGCVADAITLDDALDWDVDEDFNIE